MRVYRFPPRDSTLLSLTLRPNRQFREYHDLSPKIFKDPLLLAPFLAITFSTI